MSISGTYYLKKWIPGGGGPGGPPPQQDGEPTPKYKTPEFIPHGRPGEGFFEGEVTLRLEAGEDGRLTGTANGAPPDAGLGDPINHGFCTDDFFTVNYNVGPGAWEIRARVLPDGTVEGVVTTNEGSRPNLAYGIKLR